MFYNLGVRTIPCLMIDQYQKNCQMCVNDEEEIHTIDNIK